MHRNVEISEHPTKIFLGEFEDWVLIDVSWRCFKTIIV